MQIKKGRDRVVLLLPKIGIVLKFPIVHLLTAARLLRRYLGEDRHHWRHNVHLEFQIPIDHMMSGIKGALFRGVVASWREFRLHQTTRHAFLQPTYISLLGLVNVQKYGEPYGGDYRALWTQMLNITEAAVWADNHHFSNPDNFCVYKGKLRMLDYGNPKGYPVVLQYGDRILEAFNVSSVAVDVPEEYL